MIELTQGAAVGAAIAWFFHTVFHPGMDDYMLGISASVLFVILAMMLHLMKGKE